MLASVQYGTHMWTILLIESMEEYRVGPGGVVVGGGYDAALDHPLGSLAGGRALETISVAGGGYSHFHRVLLGSSIRGTRFTALTNRVKRRLPSPKALADANSYLSFLLQGRSPRLGVLTR
jgi:hypothetical protein